jgi:hypothetical protein
VEIAERSQVPVAQSPLLPQEVKGLEMLEMLKEQMYGLTPVANW